MNFLKIMFLLSATTLINEVVCLTIFDIPLEIGFNYFSALGRAISNSTDTILRRFGFNLNPFTQLSSFRLGLPTNVVTDQSGLEEPEPTMNITQDQLNDIWSEVTTELLNGSSIQNFTQLESILTGIGLDLHDGRFNLNVSRLGTVLRDLGGRISNNSVNVNLDSISRRIGWRPLTNVINLNVSHYGNNLIRLGSELPNNSLSMDAVLLERTSRDLLNVIRNDNLSVNASQFGMLLRELEAQLPDTTLVINPSQLGFNLTGMENVGVNLGRIADYWVRLGSRLPNGNLYLNTSHIGPILSFQNGSMSLNATQMGLTLRAIGYQLMNNSLDIEPRQLGLDWYPPITVNLSQIAEYWIQVGSQLEDGSLIISQQSPNGGFTIDSNRIMDAFQRAMRSQLMNRRWNESELSSNSGTVTSNPNQINDRWLRQGSHSTNTSSNTTTALPSPIMDVQIQIRVVLNGTEIPRNLFSVNLEQGFPDSSVVSGSQWNISNVNMARAESSQGIEGEHLDITLTSSTSPSNEIFLGTPGLDVTTITEMTEMTTNLLQNRTIRGSDIVSTHSVSEGFNESILEPNENHDNSTGQSCESLHNTTRMLINILLERITNEHSTEFQSLYDVSRNLSNILQQYLLTNSSLTQISHHLSCSQLNNITSILSNIQYLDPPVFDYIISVLQTIIEVVSQSLHSTRPDYDVSNRIEGNRHSHNHQHSRRSRRRQSITSNSMISLEGSNERRNRRRAHEQSNEQLMGSSWYQRREMNGVYRST